MLLDQAFLYAQNNGLQLVSKQEVIAVAKAGITSVPITPIDQNRLILVGAGSDNSSPISGRQIAFYPQTPSGGLISNIQVEQRLGYTANVAIQAFECLGIKSIQHEFIYTGSTTTKTISAVNPDKTIIIKTGEPVADSTSLVSSKSGAYIELLNSTTIRGTMQGGSSRQQFSIVELY
jgi:hypothetical protein